MDDIVQTELPVRAEEVREDRRETLENLMQKYLYEMTRYYPIPLGEDGNYRYKYLPLYFQQPARQAYFFYAGGTLVGFALINDYSFTGEPTDNSIAEFTVFPAFRGRGYALAAVEALRRLRPGSWQLKYSPANRPGAALWEKVAARYGGVRQALPGGDVAVSFEGIAPA